MIYAIEAVGANAVKIGFCKDVTRLVWRYEAIKTHSPFEPRVLGVIDDGTKGKEKKFHAHWADYRLRREWFELAPIKSEIRRNFARIEITDEHVELARMLRSKDYASSYEKEQLLVNDPRFASLDAPSALRDENGNRLSMHDVIGVAPEQEVNLLLKEHLQSVASAGKHAAKDGRHGAGDYWTDICELRARGYTFKEIGVELGRTGNAVNRAWGRAQKRLGKKIK